MIVSCCKFCVHSKMRQVFGTTGRYCTVEPPKLMQMQNGPNITVMGAWPPIADDDSCSSFEQAAAIPMKERA